MNVIEANELCRTFGGAKQVKALDGVRFNVESGTRVSITGRSGSGKTTLLNLLAGLDSPSSGELRVDGQSLSDLNSKELADYRLHKIGVVFQAFQLLPLQSALQNVQMPLVLSGVERAERRAKAIARLESVGLGDRVHHFPDQLSGGEKQRVAIARALVNSPRVLLADEPTGNLDDATASEVVKVLLAECKKLDATLLLVTHDRRLAQDVCSVHFEMQCGKLRVAEHSEGAD